MNMKPYEFYNEKKKHKEMPSIPLFVETNINKKLRPYQKDAIINFIYYLKDKKINGPRQILFHMATGSGKTILMAAKIIYLYSEGYRNFVFFVNSKNILNKTKENFLNISSSKYLFTKNILIDDKIVYINDVKNFENTDEDHINIIFTTIQGIHSMTKSPYENSLSKYDFDEKIIFLSDESHHLNTITKQLTKKEKNENESWEYTIKKLFNQNSGNILIEYTATMDFNNENILNKYNDKILYDYSLKQFRNDRYSKEILVLQSELEAIYRTMQAIILSLYRQKVAANNNINIKPIILLKSKTIISSKKFKEEFINKISNLKKSDIEQISNIAGNSILQNAFKFFDDNNISTDNLISEIKTEFDENRCISINSEKESLENQIKVNTLEDPDNNIRVIFAVDKLNEGWDVLNLFDIVRLYDTKNNKKHKKTTMAEAQLIGRGARYCPFTTKKHTEKYQRKFDSDIKNDLRILEELYYHSFNNPPYIQELKQTLQDTGIMAEKNEEIKITVKNSFKHSLFYKKGKFLINKKIKNKRDKICSFKDIELPAKFDYKFASDISSDFAIFESKTSESITFKSKTITTNFKLTDIDNHILECAIHKSNFYRFENLIKYFPKLKSMKEFYNGKYFFDSVNVEVISNKTKLNEFTNSEQMDMVRSVLNKLAQKLQESNTEYVGTSLFYPHAIKDIIKDKTSNINIIDNNAEFGKAMKNSSNEKLKHDLSKNDWYVHDENFGTSEEKFLIKFISDKIEKLKQKFDSVYLIRNEKYFQIYRFSDGSAFEPDFVLFLQEKQSKLEIFYQIFIEPKGKHLLIEDKWKEEFLKEIENEYDTDQIMNNSQFKIIGMPFYNEEKLKSDFNTELGKKLDLSL